MKSTPKKLTRSSVKADVIRYNEKIINPSSSVSNNVPVPPANVQFNPDIPRKDQCEYCGKVAFLVDTMHIFTFLHIMCIVYCKKQFIESKDIKLIYIIKIEAIFFLTYIFICENSIILCL